MVDKDLGIGQFSPYSVFSGQLLTLSWTVTVPGDPLMLTTLSIFFEWLLDFLFLQPTIVDSEKDLSLVRHPCPTANPTAMKGPQPSLVAQSNSQPNCSSLELLLLLIYIEFWFPEKKLLFLY